MISNDLIRFLSLPPVATSKEIYVAHNTKKKKLSERITNAPTVTLKQKYQLSLGGLESLYRSTNEDQSLVNPSGLNVTITITC